MLRRWKRPAKGPFAKGMHPQDVIDGPWNPNRRARVKRCLIAAMLWNLFATCVPLLLVPLATLIGGIWRKDPCESTPGHIVNDLERVDLGDNLRNNILTERYSFFLFSLLI